MTPPAPQAAPADLFGPTPAPASGPSRPAPPDAVRPLADRLRPRALADIVGQDHLLGSGGTLSGMLARGSLPSLILWGPPGVGKTTLARLLAAASGCGFAQLSAVFSGVADLRRALDQAARDAGSGRRTLLFVDEIHRFNRAQQDGFLPAVESGAVVLVGATTENPSFALNGALLSRCQVLVLRRLDADALAALLARAEAETGRALPLDNAARIALAAMADGDGRHLLNMAEQLFALPPGEELDPARLAAALARRPAQYDRDRDGHYGLISALHKSLRASDPDAALYWFARMLEGGEDPRFIARRLLRFASEDVGLADPAAMGHALAAWQGYERLGSPEIELALAQAVLHLATCPKSNAIYAAYKAARVSAREHGSLPPPPHLLNAPTALMRELGHGRDYVYDHDTEDAFGGADCFPEGMPRPTLYSPTARGAEAAIGERMAAWNRKRAAGRESAP